jgi:hypothetical protein
MSLAQRDYLLRMIQQLAEALGAVLTRRREGKLDEALQMLEEQQRGIFGPLGASLGKLDAPSVAVVLGTAEKARAYAMILAVEGEVRADRGEAKAAAKLRRRALGVHLEVAARWPAGLGAEDRAAIVALADEVGEAGLADAAQRALATLRGAG